MEHVFSDVKIILFHSVEFYEFVEADNVKDLWSVELPQKIQFLTVNKEFYNTDVNYNVE